MTCVKEHRLSYRCVDLYCYTGKLDQNNMVRNTRRGTKGTAPVTAKYVTGGDGADDLFSSVAQALTSRKAGFGRFGMSTGSGNYAT